MTIEDVKNELKAYKDDCKLIESIEDQICFYMAKLTSCTAQISDMPKGGPIVQDKFGEYISKLEELKAEKYTYLIELEERKQRIERTILKVEQPYRTLLHIVYIQEMSLTEAACEMKKDYKYTCKLHGKALLEYLKVREEE